jgi:hypothetical protein
MVCGAVPQTCVHMRGLGRVGAGAGPTRFRGSRHVSQYDDMQAAEAPAECRRHNLAHASLVSIQSYGLGTPVVWEHSDRQTLWWGLAISPLAITPRQARLPAGQRPLP